MFRNFFRTIILSILPLRSARLKRRYTEFQKEHQAEHDAIDAHFNHYDALVGGLKWHYVDQGPRDGQAVLFLHGLPEGWYSWHTILPLIDQHYRLIAVDMKGYGRSDKQDDDYNWHTVAAQTFALMDHIGASKFYVVGHDWGALIGSILVNDYQDSILGFVRMEADFGVKRRFGRLNAFRKKPQFLLFQINWFATKMMQDAGRFIDSVYPPA